MHPLQSLGLVSIPQWDLLATEKDHIKAALKRRIKFLKPWETAKTSASPF